MTTLAASAIGEAFREIRHQIPSKSKGKPPLTQTEMAEILDITPSNVSRIESPRVRQRPSDELIERLVAEFPGFATVGELVALRDAEDDGQEEGKASTTEPARRRTTVSGADERGTEANNGPEGANGRPAAKATSGTREQRHQRGRRSAPFLPPATGGEGAPPAAGERQRQDEVRSDKGERGAHRAVTPPEPATVSDGVTSAGRRRYSAPNTLLGSLLPSISTFAKTLTEDETRAGIPCGFRYVAAATLAVGEIERVTGDGAGGAEAQAAASALIDALWKLAARTLFGESDEIGLLVPHGEAEARRLERLLEYVPARLEAYQRLEPELVATLFPRGTDERVVRDLRIALMRAFTLGARR